MTSTDKSLTRPLKKIAALLSGTSLKIAVWCDERLESSLDKAFAFWQRSLVWRSIKHLHGPKKIVCPNNGFVVLCLLKDGEDYIKPFLEHYQALGAEHIVLLDNGSVDKTVQITQQFERTTILRSTLPFRRYKILLRTYLLSRFASDCWGLLVDVDEFFDFPYSHQLSMKDLIHYLNENSYTAVVAHLLDMFADRQLSTNGTVSDEDFRRVHKFYDLSAVVKDSYKLRNKIANESISYHRGGIRKSVFGTDFIALTKHPLLLFTKGTELLNSHDLKNASVADFSCVLYHYKFIGSYFERIVEAVEKENYADNSAQYKKYYQVLTKNPSLNLRSETATQWESTQALIDQEFLVVSDKFTSWVQQRKK